MSEKNWHIKLTPFRTVLLALTGFTLLLAIYRLFTGLGVSTNLNDQWPWGLWIGIDLTAVALAGAGFSIAVITHILHIEKYKVVTRRALMISLMGYIFVLATLILEIGRWDNFWRPFVSWGHRSPMFEVFMCIAAYTILQLVEFGEIFTEKVGEKWNKVITKILPVVFIIAALLPFGHQASLGALYLIFPDKLHPLWFSSMLPWFFLISAFFVGPAVVILESLISSRLKKRTLDLDIMQGLARISGFIMIGYLALKIGDLAVRGVSPYLFAGGLEGNMYWLELIVGLIIPIAICFSPLIASRKGLFAFSISSVLGIVLSRVNVVFVGMYAALGSGYTPSWIEWGISIGLLSAVILAYLFVVENFDIPSPVKETTKQKTKKVATKKVQEGTWQPSK